MVIDSDGILRASTEAYDTRVAGPKSSWLRKHTLTTP
jgi:hypothetical protein